MFPRFFDPKLLSFWQTIMLPGKIQKALVDIFSHDIFFRFNFRVSKELLTYSKYINYIAMLGCFEGSIVTFLGQYRVIFWKPLHPIPGIRILQGTLGHTGAGCGACLVEEAEAFSNVESDLLRKTWGKCS